LLVITGSESFVGRVLISQLINLDKEIVGFDLADKSQNYEFKRVDIRSRDISEHIPENTDAIVHLAALSSDPLCRGKGYETFDINVMGTLNLHNAGKKKECTTIYFRIN